METTLAHENLIINLIKDNLRNTRLVHGLDLLGLNTENYHLHLSLTIFNLIGIIDNRDELFEEYRELCELITQMDISKYPELLDSHAKGIYKRLIKIRDNNLIL